MIDVRRTLWLFTLLALGVQPACLTFEKKLGPIQPAVPATPAPVVQRAAGPTNFADMPPVPSLRPGERISRSPGETKPTSPSPAPRPTELTHGSEITIPAPPPGNPLLTVSANAQPSIFPTVPQVTIDPPLVAALRALLENDPPRAVEALKSLDKANQDFVLAALPALARGAHMNMTKADPVEVAVLVEQLHAAAERLEPRAALRVDKVTFCRRVTGFGRYDPWPEGQAYQPSDLAELYLEIRHLKCEPTAVTATGEAFVTRLVSSLEIRDAAGRLVDQTDPADWRRRVPVARFERTDYSRCPVRDYFLKYRFPVPAVPGAYTVTIEVRDPTGTRTARSQPIDFRVGP